MDFVEFMYGKMKEQVDTNGGVEKVLRALLVDQYGMSKKEAGKLVKAGFNKEEIATVMDEIEMADKLKADYLKLISMWKSDVNYQAHNDLEFLMKECKIPFRLVEAKNKEGTIWEVVIIEKGKSYNKTVYGDKPCNDIVDIINESDKDGAPIKCNAFKFEDTLNHLPETARKFIKGFAENIVGWFKNAKMVGKRVIAELHLDEGAKKIRSLLKTAIKKGITKPFGLSIDGEGEVEEGFDGTESVLNVLGIKSLNSVDCVTHASAGGKFLGLIESFYLEEQKMFKLLLEMVGRVFAELVEGIDLEKADFVMAKGVLEKASEKDERFKIELTEENIGEVIKNVTDIEMSIKEEAKEAQRKLDEDKKKTEPKKVEPKIDKGDGGMSEEAKKVQEELKKLREAMNKEKCGMILDRILLESNLPDMFKDDIRDEFKGKVFEEDVLKAKIDRMEKSVASFKDNDNTPQVSVVVEQRTKKIDEAQIEMDKLCGEHTDKEGNLLESRSRWRGIRAAWTEITGDEDVTGEIHPSRRGVLKEGIITSDFPFLLANSMTKKMIREYNNQDLQYKSIANVIPLTDFKTQDRITFGEFANLATVAEDAAYVEFTDPSEERAQYAAITKGNFIGISRRAILNDDLRQFSKLVRIMGRAAARTLNQFTFDIGITNFSGTINNGVIYDTTALYTSAHTNITSDALTWTSLDAAETAMWLHKDIDSRLELGIEPKYLIVPRQLKSTAERIVNTEKFPGVNNIPVNDTNPVYKSVEIMVSKYLQGDADNWYLLADPKVYDGIELGFIQGKEAPLIVTASAEAVGTMFTNDRLQYKIRHEYGAAVLDYRTMYGGIV